VSPGLCGYRGPVITTKTQRHRDTEATQRKPQLIGYAGQSGIAPGDRQKAVRIFLTIMKLISTLTLLCALSFPATAQTLFEDFSYNNTAQLKRNGWIIRTEPGWPGVPGAIWSEGGVTLLGDPAQRGNRILRMTSSTDGSTTRQTQLCHQRKYLEGTYAARVRFTDGPSNGPNGDQVVQSFYTISPLKAPMDPDYSELDFEYLPNGGWGIAGPTLYATTWETFSPEPNWKKDNVFQTTNDKQGGWHTLVTQVTDQKVRYFVDGKLFAEHGGNYYPEDVMSINFNLWFIRDGMSSSKELRSYQEDIDWVFFQANKGLTPEEVETTIKTLRREKVAFRDTVPSHSPALKSPCNF
jgi:hypothetical protein